MGTSFKKSDQSLPTSAIGELGRIHSMVPTRLDFFSHTTNRLYIQRTDTETYAYYQVIQWSRTQACNSTYIAILFHNRFLSHINLIPRDSTQVEGQHCGNYIRLQQTWRQNQYQHHQVLNWIIYIQHLPTWDRTLIKNNIEIEKFQLIDLL